MKCNGGGNGASGSSKSISESESESSEKMRDEDVDGDEAPALSLASSYIYNSVNSVIVCVKDVKYIYWVKKRLVWVFENRGDT